MSDFRMPRGAGKSRDRPRSTRSLVPMVAGKAHAVRCGLSVTGNAGLLAVLTNCPRVTKPLPGGRVFKVGRPQRVRSSCSKRARGARGKCSIEPLNAARFAISRCSGWVQRRFKPLQCGRAEAVDNSRLSGTKARALGRAQSAILRFAPVPAPAPACRCRLPPWRAASCRLTGEFPPVVTRVI